MLQHSANDKNIEKRQCSNAIAAWQTKQSKSAESQPAKTAVLYAKTANNWLH